MNAEKYYQKTSKRFKPCFLILALTIFSFNSSKIFSQTNEGADSCVELKILSWNIYMIPHLIMHTGQRLRAQEIVKSLKNEDVDVIVFQEAFDRRSRKIIREGLKDYFPYESGNPTKNVFYKANSGVWVISKVPISILKRIYFKNGRGSDKFACKGAILIEGRKEHLNFQIVATHLQADLENTDVTETRTKQFTKISKLLLEPYSKQNVPQFVVGDLNTDFKDTSGYKKMLSILNVKQCVLERNNCFSYDCSKNDIIKNHSAPPQLIDHILYNKKSLRSIEGTMFVRIFRRKWNARHSDLSDHFAVQGTFFLN